MSRATFLLSGLLAGIAVPALAQPVRATYEVYAAGTTVLELEAVFDSSASGYGLSMRFRTRGMAAALVSGEQSTQVNGSWSGGAAAPSSYTANGVWRGRARQTALAWQGGDPVVRAMVPPNEDERDAVPAELRRGTIDALSAIALLSRTVARTGACEGAAPVFDGRRRSDFASRTGGRELIRPWRSAWSGEALRCTFEGRQVAGFLRDQPRDAAPQTGTAWIAAPFAGAPPIPVRLEIPSRWFGPATAVLLRAEPASGVAELRQ